MKNELISTMTERIVRDFHPVQIILFGSHARGEAHPQSDVDLLVVFSELADKRKTAIDIRRALADLPVAKDILVTTPEELATSARSGRHSPTFRPTRRGDTL